MGRLVYFALMSLDGFTADRDGRFDWAAPDEEVHAYVNDLLRPVGTYLYGRRMYEVMLAWESMDLDNEPEVMRDFAQMWRAADKVVYSRTLGAVSSERTTLMSAFEPDAVRKLKAESDREVGIGGPGLAAHAFRAGLVDEVQLFLAPVVVGGGTSALPTDVRLDLDLLEERRFGNGMVHVRHAVRVPSV